MGSSDSGCEGYHRHVLPQLFGILTILHATVENSVRPRPLSTARDTIVGVGGDDGYEAHHPAATPRNQELCEIPKWGLRSS
jgi:hypothetical protein